MNIGIDINSIPYQRGVSRYTSNLVRALSEFPGHSLSLYGSSLRQKQPLNNFVSDIKKYSVAKIESNIQSYPQQLLRYIWKARRNTIHSIFPNIDVFHSWDWLQPPDENIPLVSTIHDLAILKYPEEAHPHIVSMHKNSWKVLKERQARIIAVSRTTKKDLVELLGYPSFLIDVIYEALPRETKLQSELLTEDQCDGLKTKLGITRPYILFVGTREPRKNLKRLIQAWEPLAKDFELVVAGEAGWDESETLKISAKAKKHLRFLGKVSDAELSVLYAETQLLAYPSIYEGFGLPILEAFHHGIPVVTSEISSMPEVAGNAAEYVDPKSVDSIRAGLDIILNESLEDQKKRLQRMIIRQQMFTWEQTAKQTLAVYKKAVQQF